MNLKLSDELRQAIQNSQGRPVELQDDRTQSVYVIVAREEFQRIVEDRLRQELQIGFDEADAGITDNWDVEEMLEAARNRRHTSANS